MASSAENIPEHRHAENRHILFPVVLLAGGAVAVARFREPGMWKRPRIRPPWRYLGLFTMLAIGLLSFSIALLASRKVPAPLIVAGALAAGFIL